MEMPARTSDEKGVRLSVKRVLCDKTEERSVHIFIPYERLFNPVFKKKNGCWGDPFYLKFWVNRPPDEFADFEPIFALSASAVPPSEKSSKGCLKNAKYPKF